MTTVFNRTVVAVLCVMALVGNSPAAWGHGAIGGAGGNTVHTCTRSLSPRIIRIVTPAEVCSSFEQGVDLPQNGTLIGVELGPAAGTGGTVSLAATADVISAPIVAACPATPAPPNWLYRAVGVTFSHTTDLAVAVSFPMSATTWQVAFIAATTGPKDVAVQAVCVREFQQT